ncbi:hypothetical protein RI367_003681, partial [Sorochytrium milnesiophthora]
MSKSSWSFGCAIRPTCAVRRCRQKRAGCLPIFRQQRTTLRWPYQRLDLAGCLAFSSGTGFRS